MAEVSFNATPEQASLDVRYYPAPRLLGRLGCSEFDVTEVANGSITIANYEEDEAEALRHAVVTQGVHPYFDGRVRERSHLMKFTPEVQVAKLATIESGDPLVIGASLRRDMYFRAKARLLPHIDELEEPEVRSFADNLKVVAGNFADQLRSAVTKYDTKGRESLIKRSVTSRSLEQQVRATAASGLVAVHNLTTAQVEQEIRNVLDPDTRAQRSSATAS